jgi:hypothetical protein
MGKVLLMCDPGKYREWLLAAVIAIFTAAGLIAAAVGLNVSFFGAPGAPVLMAVAALVAGGAALLLGEGLSQLATYRDCLAERGSRCAGDARNLHTNIEVIRLVLGVQATASATAAAYAWIPWVGAVPMSIIAGALISLALLLLSALAFFIALENCVNSESPPSPPPPSRNVRIAVGVAVIGLSAVTVVGYVSAEGWGVCTEKLTVACP